MNIKVKSKVFKSSQNKINVSVSIGYRKGYTMIIIKLNEGPRFMNEHNNESVQTTHYIVETNRLSMMFLPQLNFILQQISLYFLQKTIKCWIEQNYHHAMVALHFLVTEPEKKSILWTDVFDFKAYIENMLGEPCQLYTGGAYYV